MATWTKINRPTETGIIVPMQAPVIVSASRSTDIPAFYADWFFHRLQKGYSAWTNPFNGMKSYVSYENTRFIVFWFKTHAAALMHLISEGWELYVNGATLEGISINGTGGSNTTSYWIIRKPCTKEEFDNAVKEGIKKPSSDE